MHNDPRDDGASTPNFDSILQKMAHQEANLKLEVRFRRNMEFFSRKNQEIFDRYQDYQPEELKLLYSDDGYVNLVNCNLDNMPVYPREPVDFCREYVDCYIKEPRFYKISARQQNILGGEKDAHVCTMTPLVELINHNEQIVIGRKLQPDTNFILMLGLGLGYQVTQLMEHTHIHHLCIIEPHEDIFYASLHTLDWEALYQYFDRPHHSLKYIVGRSKGKCYDDLRSHLNLIGMHNAIRPFVFDHLSSKEIKESAVTFFQRVPSILASMGYFDDEQISLAHSVNNYRAGIPILRNHASLNDRYLDTPAFVVGNGPSLDTAREFLQANHQNAVIFSCGTSISSLRKLGIKPDFHVELERTRPIVEWIEESTDAAYRDNIVLLALNTVSPDCYGLFDRSAMAMKTNDLGAHYLSQLIEQDQFAISLAFCNPTVSNTGIAFAAALGFRDIYLFGTDLGFPQGDKHHSVLSVHYDVRDEHVPDLDLATPETKQLGRVAGNFGGIVETTVIYNASKQAMESLLRMNPKVKCYNTSDGALIEGAQPIRYNDIELCAPSRDKPQLVSELYKNYFHRVGLAALQADSDIQKSFEPAINLCDQFARLLGTATDDINGGFALLDKLHQTMLQIGLNKTTEHSYSLLKGSINTFNLALAKCLFLRDKDAESLEYFEQAKSIYIEFLKLAKHRIEHELLKNDERSRNIKDKMKD